MLLYHGTSAEVARKALKEGLVPRKLHGNSNWKHTVESNDGAVYLTTAYAGYFGMCAAQETKRSVGNIGVLEIDTTKLNPNLLCPDEDFLEAMSQNPKNTDKFIKSILRGKTMEERTEFFRENLTAFSRLWPQSLQFLGNCCYVGSIPPEAITRAVTFNWKKCKTVGWALINPSITTINYKIMGDQYKAMTRWLMGEPMTFAEFCAPFAEDFYPEAQRKMVQAELDSHAGITYLKK